MSATADSQRETQWRHRATSPRSSVEEVHARLKNMVHAGELGPGDRLPPERELCEILQVSRSTLREGLRALRSDGYLVVRRGSAGGTFISRLEKPYAHWLESMRRSPHHLREIIDVRKAVEGEIARLATERGTMEALEDVAATLALDTGEMTARQFREADAQFHSVLADAAQSPRLKVLLLEARGELFSPANAALLDDPTIARSREDHGRIFEAVRSGEAEGASRLMRRHIQSTFDDVMKALEKRAVSEL